MSAPLLFGNRGATGWPSGSNQEQMAFCSDWNRFVYLARLRICLPREAAQPM